MDSAEVLKMTNDQLISFSTSPFFDDCIGNNLFRFSKSGFHGPYDGPYHMVHMKS